MILLTATASEMLFDQLAAEINNQLTGTRHLSLFKTKMTIN